MTPPQDAMPSILVVEDDEHISHLLRFMLERQGYQVETATDGRMAEGAIRNAVVPPHLVLLDVMLPYTDGFSLVKLIRAKADWNGVPIIMLTAKNMEQDIVRALDAGANDFVLKPFQPNELLARLRRFLNR